MNDIGYSALGTNTVSSYAVSFREHQESVRKHLQGQLDSDGGQALLPSYLPPASYWTSEEKELFFHGLTIYSRLRPDLIAVHVKTKNILDVCVYLDRLQAAASREPNETTSGYVTEPAMELSDEWVSHEDILADTAISLESCSWTAKKDGIHLQPNCICPSVEVDISTHPSPTNAYFNHLDSICLMAQERILCEAEPTHFDLAPGAKTSAPEENPETTKLSPLTDHLGDVHCITSLANTSSPPMTEVNLDNMLEDENFSITDKKLQGLLKKRLYMRRKRAEQAGKAVVPTSIKLRLGRPKKVRKPSKPRPKIYNTKARLGSESGSRTHSVGPDIAASQPQPDSVEPADLNEEDLESIYEKHSQGGLKRPYRLKKLFQENGVDAELLSDMGFDFFHLSALTRLMRLHGSMNDPTESLDAVSISAHTIQLFVDITKGFVSEAVRRAVITKEQEVRLKRTMKVWQCNRDEITFENVAECLYSMGLGHLSKDKYFHLLPEDQERKSSPLVSSNHVNIDNTEKETHEEPIDDLSKDQFYRTPQFTLPESMMSCSLPNHCALFAADDILPEQIDLEDLEKELEEDNELNAEDEIASKEYESSLWKTKG